MRREKQWNRTTVYISTAYGRVSGCPGNYSVRVRAMHFEDTQLHKCVSESMHMYTGECL